MRWRAMARRSRSPICSKGFSVIENSVRRSDFPAVGAGVPEAKRRAGAVPLKREQLVHSPLLALLAKTLMRVLDCFLRSDGQGVAEVGGEDLEVFAQSTHDKGFCVRMFHVDNV